MINDQKVLGRPDGTPLTPETELDFHRGSEHLVPAPVYYGRKKETELARQAVESAYLGREVRDLETYENPREDQVPIVAPEVPRNYREKDSDEVRDHLRSQAALSQSDRFVRYEYRAREEKGNPATEQFRYIAAASENISGSNGVRQYEIDTHWNLEDVHESKIIEKINKTVKGVMTLLIGEKPVEDMLAAPKQRRLAGVSERELIQKESEIGSKLFGLIPEDQRREFFNLDPKTWIWYEEMKTPDGKMKTTTTRYEVQEKGILKAQDGTSYVYLEGDELQNFTLAVQVYYEQVLQKIYHRDPRTGTKLV